MRKAISAAIVSNGRIIVVKKGDVWILPGGKPDGNETDQQCLTRELGEELPKL